MAIYVNLGEAKARFSALVDQAMRGEDVIIQKDGVPMLRLAPLADAAQADRDARWRNLDALFLEADAVAVRSNPFDTHAWDEHGLPQ